MDDKKLIECVRQHVELYDVSDKRYVDAARKRCIWNKISQQLGYSGKLSTYALYHLSR